MSNDAASTPNQKPTVPTLRPGFRPLRMYNAIWRGAPGDVIIGAVIAQQPVELPNGAESHCAMLQILEAPVACMLFDAFRDEIDLVQPVAQVTPDSSAIVAVRVSHSAALSRILTYAEQPECQIVEIHAIAHGDYPGVRYYTGIRETTIERAKVDPMEIARLILEQQIAAATAAAGASGSQPTA